ncbi:MAG: hypothetical protein ABR569_04230 [Gaiellaceae bacterium]
MEDSGSTKRLKPVTGTYKPRAAERLEITPSAGFDRAFKVALEKAREQWGAPNEVAVNIHTQARIDIWNPGGVGMYMVTLSPK